MKVNLLVAIGIAVSDGAALAAPAQDAKLQAGKAVYTNQRCATCHSIKGVGAKAPMAALDGVGTRLAAADIRKWLTSTAEMEAQLPQRPAKSMAGWMTSKKLSDANVDALVAYLVSLK